MNKYLNKIQGNAFDTDKLTNSELEKKGMAKNRLSNMETKKKNKKKKKDPKQELRDFFGSLPEDQVKWLKEVAKEKA